jgi:hypothetical protein
MSFEGAARRIEEGDRKRLFHSAPSWRREDDLFSLWREVNNDRLLNCRLDQRQVNS